MHVYSALYSRSKTFSYEVRSVPGSRLYKLAQPASSWVEELVSTGRSEVRISPQAENTTNNIVALKPGKDFFCLTLLTTFFDTLVAKETLS